MRDEIRWGCDALVNIFWTQKVVKMDTKEKLLVIRSRCVEHPELDGCQIIKRIGRSFLVEKLDIIGYFLLNRTLACYMEICE